MQLYFLKNFFNFRKFLFVFFSLVFFLWPLYEVKAESSDAWWDFNWSRRIELKIDHTKVTGNLSNFPVYINLANLPSEFWDAVNSTNGGDIRITNKSGTQLPREIVSFTDSGSSGTGELHFLADSLSSASDSIFYIYVGNPSITHDYLDTDPYGAQAVWVDYVFVSHDGARTDSSPNPSVPIETGSVGTVAGIMGEAANYSVGTVYFTHTTPKMKISGAGTWQFWGGKDSVVFSGDSYSSFHYRLQHWVWGNNSCACFAGRNDYYYNPFIGDNNLHHHVALVNTANPLGSLQFYLDSQARAKAYASGGANTITFKNDKFEFGYSSWDALLGTGILDEVRVKAAYLSVDQIITEYNNQKFPSTFYYFSSVETVPPFFERAWASRLEFTLNGDLINAPGSGSLTDFPVYLDLSQMPDEFFQIVRSDGGDIRITDSSDNELPRELVSINRSAKTGEVHFKTDLENGADATFYLYYGKRDAVDYGTTEAYGAERVWRSEYELVSHDGGLTNSTVKSNSLNTGSMTYNLGQIGEAREFIRANNTLINPDSPPAPEFYHGAFTTRGISFWSKLGSEVSSAKYCIYEEGGAANGFQINYETDTNNYKLIYGNNSLPSEYVMNSSQTETDNWSYIAFRYDAGAHYGYMNGIRHLTGTGGVNQVIAHGDEPGIGNRSVPTLDSDIMLGSLTVGFNGYLDEIRIFDGTFYTDEWQWTEYKNQSAPSAFIKATKVIHSKSWYHDGWSNRIELVIESDKVPTDIWDFPVFVDMSSFPLVFFNKVKSDGVDIRITTEGNFELAREIVSFSKALKMGELYFKSNYLSSTKDTKFYIYYGNGDAADYPDTGDYGTHEVWSDYVLVSHDGGRTDSTENLNHGTPMNAPTIVQGIVGNDASFLTGPGYYLISHKPVLELTGDLTYSFFTKYDSSPAGWSPILAKLLSDNANELCFRFGGATSQNYYGNGTLNTLMSFNKHPAGQWFHYMSSRDISEGDLYLYGNGIQHAPAILNGLSSVSNTASPLYVGIAPGHQFTGYIDELRIKKKYEPESFANTEFENLKNNSSFLRTGRIQTPYSSKALFFGGF